MLFSEDLHHWVNASWRVAADDFPFILHTIQALGCTHLVLRQIENDIVNAMNSPQVLLDDAPLQIEMHDFACHLSRYWVKELFDNVSIVRSGRGIKCDLNLKQPLNKLFRTLNIVRQPLAKHQQEGKSVCHWPQPIFCRDHNACFGWIAHDKDGREHRISRVALAEEFLKALMPAGDQARRETL